MNGLIAFLIAKLFDPVTIVFAVAIGLISRVWWQVALGAIFVALLIEHTLAVLQLVRRFEPAIFFLGAVCATGWAFLVFLIKVRRVRGRLSS